MDIYTVDLAAKRVPRAKRFVTFLALFAEFAVLYFAIEFVFEWFWPARHGRENIWGLAFKAVFWALIMGLTFTFRKPAQYQIIVNDDEIRTNNFSSMNWLASRTVRGSEIKTIIEKRNGIIVSRHSRVGTFFWGGIWIPNQLPDYEYLKRLVFSWKAASFT